MQINNFNEMLEEIQRERGINKEALLDALRMSLLSAARKYLKSAEEDDLEARITDLGEFKIILKKKGKEKDVTPKDFGRLAAQTAKQVIIQRIREAEKEEIAEEYAKKTGDLITGIVQRREYGGYLVNIGRIETVLAVTEQIPGETFSERERIKLVIVEVKKTSRGPFVVISRAHPALIKKLFEIEVPEIKEGILEIKAIAREPGKRTKIAIHSNDPKIGAVGTCVGHMGARIQNIVRELGQERVDIIEWNAKPQIFLTNALSPAKVTKVELNEAEHSARIFLPDKDLSLAIGKEGQNVRLAVKLTGWKIDIISDEKSAAAALEAVKKPETAVKESEPTITAAEEEVEKEVKVDQKIKVHEQAKKMGLASKELLEKLTALGFEVKAANSVIPDEAIAKLEENNG